MSFQPGLTPGSVLLSDVGKTGEISLSLSAWSSAWGREVGVRGSNPGFGKKMALLSTGAQFS